MAVLKKEVFAIITLDNGINYKEKGAISIEKKILVHKIYRRGKTSNEVLIFYLV
jgi:hypothetical protein